MQYQVCIQVYTGGLCGSARFTLGPSQERRHSPASFSQSGLGGDEETPPSCKGAAATCLGRSVSKNYDHIKWKRYYSKSTAVGLWIFVLALNGRNVRSTYLRTTRYEYEQKYVVASWNSQQPQPELSTECMPFWKSSSLCVGSCYGKRCGWSAAVVGAVVSVVIAVCCCRCVARTWKETWKGIRKTAPR